MTRDFRLLLQCRNRIDKACNGFEDALRAGEPTAIRDYLYEAGEHERKGCLLQLLMLQIDYSSVTDNELRKTLNSQFPNESRLIDDAFQRVRELRCDEHLPPGTMLGRYRIERRIGQGGFSTVYEAWDGIIERPVAIKVLKQQFRPSSELEQRLRREANITGQLVHRNIIPLLDIGNDEGRLYLVMMLVSAPDLRTHLAKKVDVSQSLRWFNEIAEAIAYAHSRGVIHRDLKPSNVLMGPGEDRPYVTDFGLAIDSKPGAAKGQGGTLAYMSPEQLRGDEIDHRSDIWALGVLLYEMVVGKRPFAAMESNELRKAILSASYDDKALANAPQNVQRVCRRCLQVDPKKRFSSVNELTFCLTAAPPINGFRLSILSLAVGVSLFVIALATFFAVQTPSPREEKRQVSKQTLDSSAFLQHLLTQTQIAKPGKDFKHRNLRSEIAIDLRFVTPEGAHKANSGTVMQLMDGEKFFIELNPKRDCHVYVFSLEESGPVLLFPNEFVSGSQLKGNETFRVPGEGATLRAHASDRLECIYAIASSNPVKLPQGRSVGQYSSFDSETLRQKILGSLRGVTVEQDSPETRPQVSEVVVPYRVVSRER